MATVNIVTNKFLNCPIHPSPKMTIIAGSSLPYDFDNFGLENKNGFIKEFFFTFFKTVNNLFKTL